MPSALMTTPFGPLGIHWSVSTLTRVDLDPPTTHAAGKSEIPSAMSTQLVDYFKHGAVVFDLPLALDGTPFQQRVWALLRTIPAGETRTYGEVARLLGSAARAVGQACRANPCPIVVPCHRVVAARGLGGFAGDTNGRLLTIKRWLLQHEEVHDAG